MITEKCIFCNKKYKSTIDRKYDMCQKCSETEAEQYNYDSLEHKELIMTYSDKTLGDNK